MKKKRQASSSKLETTIPDPARRVGPEAGVKTQASSSKHQAPSSKPEACTKIRGK
jgi:hypothetical protein